MSMLSKKLRSFALSYAHSNVLKVEDNLAAMPAEESGFSDEDISEFESENVVKLENAIHLNPVYMGNNIALGRTIYGNKIYCDTRDYSLTPHILLDGFWEIWITEVFRTLVEPEMTVIDIGANIGWYSIIAAEIIGEKGKLYAFEASDPTADILYKNLMVNGFNGRSIVECKAVYSESTTLQFKTWKNFKGSNSLFSTDESAASYKDELEVHEVKTISLDEYFSANTKIDFIKIDAEGAEPFILKGAKRLIEDNPNIIIMVEFAPGLISGSYGDVEKYIDEIHDFGFKIYSIEHDSTLQLRSKDELIHIQHRDIILRR